MVAVSKIELPNLAHASILVHPDHVDHPVFCSQVVSVAAAVYVVHCMLLLHSQLLAVVRFADLQVFIFQHCQNLCIVDPVG